MTHCENPSVRHTNCFGNRGKRGNTGIEQRCYFCPMLLSNCPFVALFLQSSTIQVLVLYCTMRWDPNNHHLWGNRRNPIHLGWSQCCSSSCLCNPPPFSNLDLYKLMTLHSVGPILLGNLRMIRWAVHFDLETYVLGNPCTWYRMHR